MYCVHTPPRGKGHQTHLWGSLEVQGGHCSYFIFQNWPVLPVLFVVPFQNLLFLFKISLKGEGGELHEYCILEYYKPHLHCY